eukprot:6191909-Pleurochrysis_carterae.AAC.2
MHIASVDRRYSASLDRPRRGSQQHRSPLDSCHNAADCDSSRPSSAPGSWTTSLPARRMRCRACISCRSTGGMSSPMSASCHAASALRSNRRRVRSALLTLAATPRRSICSRRALSRRRSRQRPTARRQTHTRDADLAARAR